MHFRGMLLAALLLTLLVSGAQAQSGYFPVNQTPLLAVDEAETVYRTNLARQANGLPPLRWNTQLTQASRWFAWDSVENRPDPYCGHQDTLGNWPDVRARAFGYPGSAGAENAFCGYVTPQYAVDGWMGSSGHAGNILDPNNREVGLGYYRRNSDGRGYVVQDFGNDPAYAPLVINREALDTTTSQVDLYIYNRVNGGGFAALRPVVSLQISNDACFTGAVWQPFNTDAAWTLPPGEGWKTVYARSRDAYGYTTTAEDAIYLGSNPPIDQISTTQMSSSSPDVTLYELDGSGRSSIQFSLGWLADQFKRTTDNTLITQTSDPQALDGQAMLLSGNSDTVVWDWTTMFYTNTPMVAYFRLKVNDNTSVSEVAKLKITAGTNSYDAVSVKGNQFKAANQYQEFAVPFNFAPDSAHPFLVFEIHRSPTIALSIDAVTIFTAPQSLTGASMTVAVPGGSYRGQGVWLRYSDADLSNFTSFSQAVMVKPELRTTQNSIEFLAGLATDDPPPGVQEVAVQVTCGASFTWQVSDNAAWLQTVKNGDIVDITVNPKGLAPGTYQAALTFTASNATVPLVQVPVTFTVVPDLKSVYLPSVRR